MSSTASHSRWVSDAPGPGPLMPPSPVLSPSRSWRSGSGVIPIFLDPALACSPPNETLPLSDSMSSLFPPPSVIDSVGTFGQPVRRDLQRPKDLSICVSAKINAWRNVDSVLLPSPSSFGVAHNAFRSDPSLTDLCTIVDPGTSHSDASTPTMSMFPFSEGKENDMYRAEQESDFTLSAYLASASVYGDADEDNGTSGERTPHNTPLITRSDAFEDQECSISVMRNIVAPKYTLDQKEPSPKTPPPNEQLALNGVEGVRRHSSLGRVTLQTQRGMNNVDTDSRTPTLHLRRKKSQLDVPLSPTSTFLLSPSASTSSRNGQSGNSVRSSTSVLHSLHAYRHCRAASVPLSPLNHTHDTHNVLDEEETLTSLASHTLRRTHAERPRTSLNSRIPIRPASHDLRPRANSHPQKNESSDERFVNTSSEDCHKSPSTKLSSMTINNLTAPTWIRDITVVLWIDQEGFRSIRPKFKLIGYTGKTGTSPDGHVLDVAKFAMRKQQTWHFHHAVSAFLS